MLYLIAEDEYYYSQMGINEIKESYKLDEIIPFPTFESINKEVSKQIGSLCFLAPYPPSTISKLFSDSSLFEVVKLKNRFGFLTTGQKNQNIPEKDVLANKLGVKIYEPKMTFKDYGGAEILTESLLLMEEKEKYGIQSKGFMIAGIPGTGKSFFAKCAAGETGRKLVELNLSLFLEKEDGLQALSDFFDFFKVNKGRYILWIDEIEKMLLGSKSEQMLGLLLNRINDLNDTVAESSILFIATANNITGLAKKNPEFFRNGRFDVLVFIKNPTEENAKNIFNIHLNSQIKKFKNEIIPIIIQNTANGIKARENTLSQAIQDFILTFDKVELDKLKDVSKSNLLDFINKNETLKECYDHIIKNFPFNFPINEFMLAATSHYGESCIMTDRYPHTPAEIEYIVHDAFASHYFSATSQKTERELIKDLVSKYQPLQVTMKEGITAMLGTADKFLKI